MRRVRAAVLLVSSCFAIMACAEKPVDMSRIAKKKIDASMKFHGEAPTDPGKPLPTPIAEKLKVITLNKYPQKTIGSVFDTYKHVVAKEWKEGFGRDNKIYVDYIGWFDEKTVPPAARNVGVVKWGVDVKFAIQENGETYVTLVTKLLLLKDGTIQTELFAVPFEQVVDSIYSGKELTF